MIRSRELANNKSWTDLAHLFEECLFLAVLHPRLDESETGHNGLGADGLSRWMFHIL